jgi:polysaccharide deacetylase 2 family uncharacterized protein YibQ
MPRVALLLLLALSATTAAAEPGTEATIGLIIDDLGNNLHEGERAAHLPGAVACAILPHTRYARTIADAAFGSGKEVMLHLPMESRDAREEPGPGQLDTGMPALEMRATLDYNLTTVPHVVGVNNHMGSLLTTEPVAMDWLMRELGQRHLFFIDSRTAATSVAAARARLFGVPVLERDVFLDDDLSPQGVQAQLERLERLARRRGFALAIGHPHPVTLTALEKWLPRLQERGVRLIPLTVRMAEISQETKPWRASLSR